MEQQTAVVEAAVIEEVRTFEIYEGYMEILEKKIGKMNRKATKLGLVPLSFEVVEKFTRTRNELVGYDNNNKAVYRQVVDHMNRVRIDGQKPIVKGYEFIAKLEHLEEGNLIRAISDEGVPVRFRNASCACNHCNTNRKRKVTYVIRDMAEQTYMQVGKSCLGDFFPYTNVEAVASYIEWVSNLLGELEEDSRNYTQGEYYKPEYSLIEYLTITAAVIEKFGWLSKTQAQEIEGGVPTSAVAWSEMIPESSYNRHELKAEDVTDAHEQTAREAIEWATEQVKVKMTDFNHNMSLIASRGSIVYNHTGFAAYIVAGYLKHKENLNAKKFTKQNGLNEYFGEIGDKVTVTVNVVAVREFDGWNGATHMHEMKNSEGRTFVWWCSNAANRIEEGAEGVTIKGTIKEHKDYKGTRQTVLTRCKVEA